MITDIPEAEDFRNSGIDFLNLAWTMVTEIHYAFHHYHDYYRGLGHEGKDAQEIQTLNQTKADEYWSRSQRSLTTALSLVQQGAEFLLKGRITEVSPYLLLTGGAKNCPVEASQRDVPFSDLKTIDAQDLVKTNNIFTQHKLSGNFEGNFKELRKKRNTYMHSIGSTVEVNVQEILKAILEVSHHLIGRQQWLRARESFIENSPDTIFMTEEYWDHDLIQAELIDTAKIIINSFEPDQVRKYLNFPQTSTKYICPHCYFGVFRRKYAKHGMQEDIPRLAYLSPEDSSGQTLFCLICDEETSVTRSPCDMEDDCTGNVIYDNLCLTCGIENRTKTNQGEE